MYKSEEFVRLNLWSRPALDKLNIAKGIEEPASLIYHKESCQVSGQFSQRLQISTCRPRKFLPLSSVPCLESVSFILAGSFLRVQAPVTSAVPVLSAIHSPTSVGPAPGAEMVRPVVSVRTMC